LHTDLDKVFVQLSVILGKTVMPVHKLLRMGRGAVIELTAQENDLVEIVADGHVFAHGQVIVSGSRIQVEITELLRRPRIVREKGAGEVLPEPEPEPLAA
jgi:flagellar motor switch protein FliN